MKAVATYQRVSNKEQARDSEAFTRQGWQLDREIAKYPDRARLRFSDIQSGRRDDRPDFLKLIAAIETGKIDILIITRIEREARRKAVESVVMSSLIPGSRNSYSVRR